MTRAVIEELADRISDAQHMVETQALFLRTSEMDVVGFNSRAWDREVKDGNPWTCPVRPDEVDAARRGDWRILLTPSKPVPRDWFGTMLGANVLCLASGGGQQGPILAAAGANVTVLDNSPAQLAQDQHVATRDSLKIRLELGQMENLSRFSDSMFDLIVHPVSNLFTPDVRRVWQEVFRVLRRGGSLLAGFANPARYLFDARQAEKGLFVVRHALPYSDIASLPKEELDELLSKCEPLEFGHSLQDQIGGQVDAGFLIRGFYEDRWPDHPLDQLFPLFVATRSWKP
jgi:SAM-dependent methyltransferase